MSTKNKKIRADYNSMTKAFNALQNSLVPHIYGTLELSKKEIDSIIELEYSILDSLKEISYEVYDELPDMTKHMLDDKDYKSSMLEASYIENIEEQERICNRVKEEYKDHLAWKAERLKHLQELFPNKRGSNPHNEEWFVKSTLMYNENF